jgi:hypothetical protein
MHTLVIWYLVVLEYYFRLSVQFNLKFGCSRLKLGRGNAVVLMEYTSNHTYEFIANTSDDFCTPFPGDVGADSDWSVLY